VSIGATVPAAPGGSWARRAGLVALAVAGSLTLGATAAHACSKTWVAGAGDWTSGASWSPAGVPGATDDVCLPPGASYVVTLTANGGAAVAVRSLTVGGDGPGEVTLAIQGQVPGAVAPVIDDVTLTTSEGGTIGANGNVVLGTTSYGGATLAGATISNGGTIVARSGSPNVSDHLRASVVNEPTGKLTVASGQLVSDSGSTFQNLGTVVVNDPGSWLITTDPALSATPTRMINSGLVSTGDGITARDATWTQAGGTVSNGPVQIESGLLDDETGTGAFALSAASDGALPSAAAPPRLAGTIPPNQTVTASGTLQLVGPVVENDGTLVVTPVSYGPAAGSLPMVLGGSPLDNAGQLTLAPEYSDGPAGTVYLRTDLRNEGVLAIGKLRLVQDSGTELDSSGLLEIAPKGRYSLSAPSTASRHSTFANVAPGIVSFDLAPRSSGRIQLGPGGAMTVAGGIAAPALGFVTNQGDTYDVVTSSGGSLTGAFTSGMDGFRVLTSRADSISLAFGQVATNAKGGRLAFRLTDACPPGSLRCYLHVRATASEQISTWLGTGAKRRRRTRIVTTTVANVGLYVAPDETRVFTVRLNARGRALVERAGRARPVAVAAISDTRTILRARVAVRP
jgi:hypothetical protein